MKKNITIIGVGKRMTGTSKANKPYDFTPVSFTYEDEYMNGLKAATVNIDGKVLEDYFPAVGDTVTVFMHEQNYRLYIDGIM